MKQHDLCQDIDPTCVGSLLFQRRFIVDSMHELLWKRIFPIRQTNHDTRLSDYEAVYNELGKLRDEYDKILIRIPKEDLAAAAYLRNS